MADTDRGTAEPGSSRSGTDAEPTSKKGKEKAKAREAERKKEGSEGGGSDAENGNKSGGTKEEKAPGKEGKKKGEEQRKENGKKEMKNDDGKKDDGKKDEGKKDEGKKDEGKKESVKTSIGMKEGKNEGNKVDPLSAKKLDDLMKLWMEFQSTNRDSSMKIQRLESTLNTLETSLDRFGKFCGEYQLIWRVKGFSQRFDEARSGERPIIYSPTFDTHRSGYKLQLSLCPNGDGKGNGVSLSLFFAILKGPYDSLLQWPFTCPVTMTLLEQVPDLSAQEPRDVTMTFVPNPRPDNLPFLGKPDEAKNLSLGFQKFVQLTDLFEGQYIQDDSIFIKVYVDISNVMAL